MERSRRFPTAARGTGLVSVLNLLCLGQTAAYHETKGSKNSNNQAESNLMPAIDRQGYAAGQQITKRLDALGNLRSGCFGVSWWFVRMHLIAGGAWAMVAAQTMSVVYMTSALTQEFPVTYIERAFLLIGAIMLGAVVGAFFFGYLADARGRKFSSLVAFVLTHFAGTLCALSSSAEMLTVLRFIVGIGLGGQQPIITTLIMELAPTSIRGRALVYLDAYWSVGAIFTMAISREVEPTIGWRAVCALSTAALFYFPLLYYCVPESSKWLATSGKIDEALRVLRMIEQASSVFHDEEADDAIKIDLQLGDAIAGTKHMILQVREPSLCELVIDRVRILMRFPYLPRTLMLWFVWFVMAMTNSAMCVYLDDAYILQIPKSGRQSLHVYSVLVARLLGNLAACSLINRIGRRYTIVSFLALASASSLVQVYLDQTNLEMMLLSSCCRNFAFTGAWGCLFAYTPELYPTSIRVVGISYAWGISRLGYFAGPHVVLLLTQHLQLSTSGIMWVFFVISFCAATSISVFGIETVNRDPERAGVRTSSMMTERETDGNVVVSYQKHEDEAEEPAVVNPSRPAHFM